jgi:translation initiation factor IF-3
MKVRVKLRFRGRQRAHKEYGFEVVNKFVKEAPLMGRPIHRRKCWVTAT